MPFRLAAFLAVLGALLAALLLLPLVWPVPELEDTRAPRELARPGDRFVEAAGVELRSRAALEADGAELLLVHGFASNLATWHAWLERLRDEARLVAFDRIGFGLSARPTGDLAEDAYALRAEVEQALAVMEAYDLDRPVLVGHSSGAALALRLALEHPERAAGLVLIGPVVGEGAAPRLPARWLLRTPQLERIGPLLMRRLGGEAGRTFLESAYSEPERIDPEVHRAYRDATSVHDWDHGLWEVVKASRPPALAGRLGDVTAPALVMAGSEDAILSPDDARAVAEGLPAASFARLDGCGHAAHDECPEAALSRLRAWLEDTGQW